MTTQTEKKERSLAEFVVIVSLVGVLMAIFINFYIKNESKFTQAGFATIAQSFNIKVNAVHAQWLMDKQPNVVYLASMNNTDKEAIPVNKSGWIDVKQAKLSCEAIWQLVVEMPISEMSYSVSAIEVHTLKDNKQNRECRYVLLDGSYFQYNRAKGKVSNIIMGN